MNNAAILIVEDEILIAEDLKDTLTSLGFNNIDMAHDKESALQKMKTFSPQVVLLDVHLENETDGIAIGKILQETKSCQFIYVTAHSDVEMVKQIIQTSPAGYITKPVKKSDLFASVGLALSKLDSPQTTSKSIQFKDGYETVIINTDTICYVEAEGNYLNVFCDDKKYVLRQSLESFIEEADSDFLFKIHRSYLVNIFKIVRYSKKEIFIGNKSLPISRSVKDDFEDFMKTKINA
jgi:two-component system response regulator LytT